jgi:hypothetical protein
MYWESPSFISYVKEGSGKVKGQDTLLMNEVLCNKKDAFKKLKNRKRDKMDCADPKFGVIHILYIKCMK